MDSLTPFLKQSYLECSASSFHTLPYAYVPG